MFYNIDPRYNLQTGGVPGAGNPGPGGPQDPTKRMHSHPHNRRYNNNMMTPPQSGTYPTAPTPIKARKAIRDRIHNTPFHFLCKL